MDPRIDDNALVQYTIESLERAHTGRLELNRHQVHSP
jgi:hypothetical protein